MSIKIFQVDAFTSQRFKGNPAAVCLLEHSMPDDWMLKLAQEMNLSETAFLLPIEDGYSLRWFTPKLEVNLCGHATLASAHVLFETGRIPVGQLVRFSTRSGDLKAQMTLKGVELDFPSSPAQIAATMPLRLLDALGIREGSVLISGNKHLIEISTEAELRALQPDFIALARIPGRGVAVTAKADTNSGYDFVSRYFAPWVGINEDPVTGSAHCMLGPYWAEKLGKTELLAYQASARGGSLGVRVTKERTYLTGQAVTVFSGEMETEN
jgi:PhzF family phenazine biosynthesis protein